LTSEAHRNNDDIEGFGLRWDDSTQISESRAYRPAVANYTSIPANGKRQSHSNHYLAYEIKPNTLPLQWGGLVLEFELVTSCDMMQL
jgi:hypothetical protein